MENKKKALTFFVLTVIMGMLSTFAYAYITFGSPTEIGSPTGIVLIACLATSVTSNFILFVAMFWGMPLYTVDSSNYHTTTVTYSFDSDGEIQSSETTPDDKAASATFWGRVGLSVVSFLFSPLSNLIFVFYLAINFCQCDYTVETKHRAIMIVAGVLAIVLTGVLTFLFA